MGKVCHYFIKYVCVWNIITVYIDSKHMIVGAEKTKVRHNIGTQ